jgi:hypothetical protein
MKFINDVLVIFILLSLVSGGLAATTGPITMRSGANITLSSGYIHGLVNGTGQDAATVSQVKNFSRTEYLYVGPSSDCDYWTDGNNDQINVNQALVAANGQKTVVLLGKIYVNYPINITVDGSWLRGTFSGIRSDGSYNTMLYSSNPTANIINVTKNARISDLQIQSAPGVTLTDGDGIHSTTTSHLVVQNVFGALLHDFLYAEGSGSIVWWTDCSGIQCTGTYYDLNGVGDATIDNLACDSTDALQDTTMRGLYVRGGVSNLEASNLELQHAGSCLLIDGVWAADFVNCKFDNGEASSAILSSTVLSRHIKFTNCWFTVSAYDPNNQDCMVIDGADCYDIVFNSCTFRDPPNHGLVIGASNPHNITVANSFFTNMGRSYSGSYGIFVYSGNDLKFIGNSFARADSGANYQYAIVLNGGTNVITMMNMFGGIPFYSVASPQIYEHNLA